MKQKLNAKAWGYSLAILSGVGMLLMGVLGNLGIYLTGVEAMKQWHLFFDLSFIGIVAGIIEAGLFSFVFGWLFAIVYNKFA